MTRHVTKRAFLSVETLEGRSMLSASGLMSQAAPIANASQAGVTPVLMTPVGTMPVLMTPVGTMPSAPR